MLEFFDNESQKRFWSKVNKTETCWLWIAYKNKKDYGCFGVPKTRKIILAHRLSYILSKGEIPYGLFVLHSCDTPSCVNPKHLFLGTNKDNMEDMAQKGRASHAMAGSGNGRAKLSETDVIAIKIKLNEGYLQYNIAKEYKIAKSVISSINKGKLWRHVLC